MKKKLLSLILVFALLFSNSAFVFAEDELTRVSSDVAFEQVESGEGIILDVRATDVYYQDGYIDGSLHQPLFNVVDGKNVVTDRTDELAQNFNAFVAANKELLTSKNIYILCNSGASGAAAATALLKDAGLTENVFTIENGAKGIKASAPELFVNQQYVSAEDTLAAQSSSDVVIIDVRAVERYTAGHLKGVASYPVFTVDENDKNVVTSCYDQLAMDFLAKVEANADAFAGKDIYIICNSGASGAKAATKLLMQAGYSNSNIYTVEGGAKALADSLYFVSSDYAFAQVEKDAGIILDVRATDVYYEKGYVDGSLHQPLFNVVDGKNVVTDRTDELAQNFNAFVAANKELLTNTNVYILCNGGASGAAAATALLKDAGITGNVYTIEGGAGALYGTDGIFVNQQYVSAEETLAAGDDVIVIDVRAAERYAAGHIKGSTSYPVFTVDENDKNVVSTGYDQLAIDFLAKVEANAAKFAGKDIYIICNSGASGAKAATKLLMQAGYSNSNIYTVEGGAKAFAAEDFVTEEPVAAPAKVLLSKTTYTYNGNAKKPVVTVRDENGDKISKEYYTVKYSNNVKAGTGKVTVTFKGEYAEFDAMARTFTIEKANASTVKLASSSYTYTGKSITPTFKTSAGVTLSKSDYTITSIKSNKNPGKVTVKVKFKGNYKSATRTFTFKINPKGTSISSLTKAKKAFTVKWKAQKTQTTGYQVQYSRYSSFKNATTKTVSKSSTSKKITGLTSGKTYYVRVRTYKTVNGTKYYSSWSSVKKVTTK